MNDRYAVIGHPIDHSKSPRIHAAFAAQTGENIDYGRVLGRLDGVEEDVRGFFAGGGRGLNVTVPFKEAAWRMADQRSARAEIAGAVNTLWLGESDALLGDNTDGVGLVRDLEQNHGCRIDGRRVLLLGAGGASRGVVRPLLETRPQALIIANRTAAKAEELAASLADVGRVQGCGLDALAGHQFDLIINGTSAGLGGSVPQIPDHCLAADGWCYDMVYGDQDTPFQRWGMTHGAARALDGLGMLVEQAAESFFIWRGCRPDTAPVIELLRSG